MPDRGRKVPRLPPRRGLGRHLIALSVAAVAMAACSTAAHAGQEGAPARVPQGGLDLDVKAEDLASTGDGAGSFSSDAQKRESVVNWSRSLREDWELNTLVLHRRQAGQPVDQGDAMVPETFGLELRRKF